MPCQFDDTQEFLIQFLKVIEVAVPENLARCHVPLVYRDTHHVEGLGRQRGAVARPYTIPWAETLPDHSSSGGKQCQNAENISGECRFASGGFPSRDSILTPGMTIAVVLLWKGPCAEYGLRVPLRIRAMAHRRVRAGAGMER